jgi:hypothetical protein
MNGDAMMKGAVRGVGRRNYVGPSFDWHVACYNYKIKNNRKSNSRTSRT